MTSITASTSSAPKCLPSNGSAGFARTLSIVFRDRDMTARELNVELLLSRRVYALNGRRIGRIEEIRAEKRGRECYVAEYLVGGYALFERLAGWVIGRAILNT